jgi:hypothetical protein
MSLSSTSTSMSDSHNNHMKSVLDQTLQLYELAYQLHGNIHNNYDNDDENNN